MSAPDKQMIEQLRLYAEELIEPHDGDIGGARMRAAKIMREAAEALSAITTPNGDEARDALERELEWAAGAFDLIVQRQGIQGDVANFVVSAAARLRAALAKEKRG